MENFTAYNPTKLHFGKDILADLDKTLLSFGKKVLLVYGKTSIKKSGLYDIIEKKLKQAGIEIYEYCGIKPNPLSEDVDAAASIGRENEVDVILAVGGGSVIDSAKIISIAIPVLHSCWDFYEGKAKPRKAIPLIAILTLAATGTEMNPYAVLQNNKARVKDGYGSPLCFPVHSYLDPQNTFTVPADQTAFGIADLIAHCLEAYFGKGKADLSDRFVISIIKEAMEIGPKLMTDLKNYELRERIMCAATCALNGTCFHGRTSGDWGVHGIGHCFSLLYDIAHGASLSIAYPAWLKLQKERIPEKIKQLGIQLFGVSSADETIAELEKFFKSIGCPHSLKEAGISSSDKNELLEVMKHNKVSGGNHKLNEEDYRFLLNLV
jgi:alcohol dehydrogenase YqhD (iron-dependent ADH family)